MPKLIDLSGQTFGRLTVVRRHGLDGRNTTWLCTCDCGGPKADEVIVQTYNLRHAKTVSCGCVRKENSAAATITHGMSETRVYHIWKMMLQRCTNPKADAYSNYGGRGITVDPSWHEFEKFYADMGEPPSPKHTLEREDNNGNYTSSNCKWATDEEQANNRRTNVTLTLGERTMTKAQWARELGITDCSLQNRLDAGWSVERALTTKKRGTQ
jgi:hypothetical protein